MMPWGTDADPGDYSSPDMHDIRGDNGPYGSPPLITRVAPEQWLAAPRAPQLDPQWDADARIYSWAPAPPHSNEFGFAPSPWDNIPARAFDDESAPYTRAAGQLHTYVPPTYQDARPIAVDNDALPYQQGGNDNYAAPPPDDDSTYRPLN